MLKVLWVAPILNHYKARFLNRLSGTGRVELTVLAGKSPASMGHRDHGGTESFVRVDVDRAKGRFEFHPEVYRAIKRLVRAERYDVVLLPMEKKTLVLALYLWRLKRRHGFKLACYTHPVTRGSRLGPWADKTLTRLMFALYDRVIFYTEAARDWALKTGLTRPDKAFFANNTLDTRDIRKHYDFEVNRAGHKTLLFIGRLTANKNLGLLLDYHRALGKRLPGTRLRVIGDGPRRGLIEQAAKADPLIEWFGAIVDEAKIAGHMRLAHLVLVPGWSGLSIVHAFCYGKPYATVAGEHPPEFSYLKDNVNGLVLSGDVDADAERMAGFLSDHEAYAEACRAAFETANSLSIENWLDQMAAALAGDRVS